ncbi:MAG: N-acetylmuramoyl-L-alanine amidase, partial [Pseudomonadota bacterium]
GALRLVVGSPMPFVSGGHFILSSNEEARRRLVIDLKKATRPDFELALRKQSAKEKLLAFQAQSAAEARDKAEARSSVAEKSDNAANIRRWRVVIDPGHGGKDGGARTTDGTLEKEIVLSFSNILADALSGSGRFDVILTRTSDVFVPLKERVAIAQRNKADLFVSIHADSLPSDRTVRGTAVYTISRKASDRMTAEIAAQQNKSDAIAGYEVKDAPNAVVDILFDLTRRETSNLSALFARHFVGDMRGKIRFFKFPLQRGAFTVLRVPDIPSALIELGFLSNAADAKQLSSAGWREKVALEMAAAIARYFDQPVARLKP